MHYVYGTAVDELLARTDSGGNTDWYLTDRLASVRDIVSTTGSVLDQIAYDSYGNVTSESSPSSGDRFKYAGMLYDSATGLYFDNARYYDPSSGRFVSQDPKRFGAGDANLYRYVANSPTDATDPSGLQALAAIPSWMPPPQVLTPPGPIRPDDPNIPGQAAHPYPLSPSWVPALDAPKRQWKWWHDVWLPYMRRYRQMLADQRARDQAEVAAAVARFQAQIDRMQAEQAKALADSIKQQLDLEKMMYHIMNTYIQNLLAAVRHHHPFLGNLGSIIAHLHPHQNPFVAIGPGVGAIGGQVLVPGNPAGAPPAFRSVNVEPAAVATPANQNMHIENGLML